MENTNEELERIEQGLLEEENQDLDELLKDFLEEPMPAFEDPDKIEISDETIVDRMSGRRVCESCGASYHIVAVPPKTADVCDKCGGKLIQRKDDEPATVKARLEVYHKETEPLKAFYAERGLLRSVDNQPSVEAVSEAILRVLGK